MGFRNTLPIRVNVLNELLQSGNICLISLLFHHINKGRFNSGVCVTECVSDALQRLRDFLFLNGHLETRHLSTVSTTGVFEPVWRTLGLPSTASVRSYCTEEDEEDEEQSGRGGVERLPTGWRCFLHYTSVAASFLPQVTAVIKGVSLALTSTFPVDYVRLESKAGPKIKDSCQRWQIPALA